MKVMLRLNDAGTLIVYVPKKDLEEEVVKETDGAAGKILTLANGWELEFSDFPDKSRLPFTVEGKRLP
ncbi:putative nitrogen fixation protein NifT [Dolichospermum circinale]|jgi:nitrogen fixation protein NifT|uniref:putative nitrogen fixation protein NifT n=1 Tax=Dolichospermum circinale TaxID=109265 RepID=UPI001AF527B1|nr:putative nitrogen fixation protein NifT [Dolichospermum circinale]MBS3025931.1 putative nitrogen fixation protein NifT [Dolichospermum sp. DET66]MBS3031127.1 putative nitrogen fixation protein NifT [Dolichospermum sp. DET67]MBS3036337.1 putative nitrogen fixation protein NifT [Dolichospermum sp. DET50]QSX68398.1 MAG: putative nitrogen fixation protein NifT [Dolichospermum sp. DET69]MDB9451895.1 putative nitrogen fixation protein NifT [Dolichospermum circinale CS-547]